MVPRTLNENARRSSFPKRSSAVCAANCAQHDKESQLQRVCGVRMSADRAAQDLAGEEGPSASEGLRQDTRTSNSEMYDNFPPSSSNPGQQSASGNEGVGKPFVLLEVGV